MPAKNTNEIYKRALFKDQLISKYHFGAIKFFQKTERKQVNPMYHSS